MTVFLTCSARARDVPQKQTETLNDFTRTGRVERPLSVMGVLGQGQEHARILDFRGVGERGSGLGMRDRGPGFDSDLGATHRRTRHGVFPLPRREIGTVIYPTNL
jgi:hypothetical protein